MLNLAKQFIKRHERLRTIIVKSQLLRKLVKVVYKLNPDFIDVEELIKNSTVEELSEKAEQYFARLSNYDYQLAKPFASIDEAPELLTAFASLLSGLRLLPWMTILDFGAGTCWTSRYLSQIGCRVIALDVSLSALKIGQELYTRQPVIGNKPQPLFLQFDAHKIALADGSIDRILCFDAFHHVPNPEEVIKEFARVLKQGGIAGFSEPGPFHSLGLQSQYEMKNFGVIENDVIIQDIWKLAKESGFTKIEIAIFSPKPMLVSLEEFELYLKDGPANKHFAKLTQNEMQYRRMFFLYKGDTGLFDSRKRKGLLCKLDIEFDSRKVKVDTPFSAHVTITNIGSSLWLPTTARIGAVHLGAHLYDSSLKLKNYDYFRHLLTSDCRSIMPNETIVFSMKVPSPPKGRYILEFDLVSENVCWFQINGSKTVQVEIEVV